MENPIAAHPIADTRPGGRPRRGWIAVLLSLLTSGLGHLYAGRARRGVAAWLAATGVGVLAFLLVLAFPSPAGLAAFAVLVAGAPIAVAADAARLARSAAAPFALRPYNRWYVYPAVIALMIFAVQPGLKRLLSGAIVDATRLPTGSMAPTYLAGDFLFVAPLRHAPARGEVVVYRTELGPFLKRVVGVPGDTIAMRNARLIVNGAVVAEPYEIHGGDDPGMEDFQWQRRHLAPGLDSAQYHPTLHTWGPLVVPQDEYFLLGDDRSNSLDSRYMGFSPYDALVSRPVVIYFSWDSAARAIRWRRLGYAPK